MNIQQNALRVIKQTEFTLRKHAPTILTGAGVAGFIATTVLTVRATAKAVDTLPAISDAVRNVKSSPVTEDWTEKDKQKQLIEVYVRSSRMLAKDYWPVLAVG